MHVLFIIWYTKLEFWISFFSPHDLSALRRYRSFLLDFFPLSLLQSGGHDSSVARGPRRRRFLCMHVADPRVARSVAAVVCHLPLPPLGLFTRLPPSCSGIPSGILPAVVICCRRRPFSSPIGSDFARFDSIGSGGKLSIEIRDWIRT